MSASTTPGTLIPIGNHVVFATSAREAERAIVLLMEGAGEDLRRACTRALESIRGEIEEAAA